MSHHLMFVFDHVHMFHVRLKTCSATCRRQPLPLVRMSTTMPYSPHWHSCWATTIPRSGLTAAQFRVLLLCRLRLLLQLAPRTCCCHGHFGCLGGPPVGVRHFRGPGPSCVGAPARGCPCVPGSERAGVPQRAPGRYECGCAHRGRTSH